MNTMSNEEREIRQTLADEIELIENGLIEKEKAMKRFYTKTKMFLKMQDAKNALETYEKNNLCWSDVKQFSITLDRCKSILKMLDYKMPITKASCNDLLGYELFKIKGKLTNK